MRRATAKEEEELDRQGANLCSPFHGEEPEADQKRGQCIACGRLALCTEGHCCSCYQHLLDARQEAEADCSPAGPVD